MLPLAEIRLQKLQLFGKWNTEAKIEFLFKILGSVVGEASLQHFLCRHKLTSWLIQARLKAPRRL
jgi:hypothetical protein